MPKDITKPIQPPSAYSPAELERRRENGLRADHQNRLEGIEPNPAAKHINDAYERGELDAEGAIAAWRTLNGIPPREEALRRIAAGLPIRNNQ